jgi:hypothetical protein
LPFPRDFQPKNFLENFGCVARSSRNSSPITRQSVEFSVDASAPNKAEEGGQSE